MRDAKPNPGGTLLVLLAIGSVIAAAEPDPAVPARPHGLRQIGHDVSQVVQRPFRLQEPGRRRLLAVAGSTVALFVMREEIRDFVQDHKSESLGHVVEGARTMGKGAFAPALALAAWGASFATHDERERETAVLLLESMGLSAAAALSGSFILASERPDEGDTLRLFDREGHGVSLDAALAASVIPPLTRRYLAVRPEDGSARRFWKRAGAGLLYTGAALTAYQRLYDDKHWAPDAFAGVMTGLAIGGACVDVRERPGQREPELDVLSARGAMGLRLRLSGRGPIARTRGSTVSP